MNLPDWATRIQAIWVAIGTFLMVLAGQGVDVPEWMSGIFSELFVQATITVVGAVVVFYQFIRGIFSKDDGDTVQTLSAGKKLAYTLNPFKLKA